MSDTLDRLYKTIESRRGTDPKSSYTAQLLVNGTSAIIAKITEETGEMVRAALDGEGKPRIVAESADLLYHLLVLWAAEGVKPEDVWAELTRREGTSGIEEKRNRK